MFAIIYLLLHFFPLIITPTFYIFYFVMLLYFTPFFVICQGFWKICTKLCNSLMVLIYKIVQYSKFNIVSRLKKYLRNSKLILWHPSTLKRELFPQNCVKFLKIFCCIRNYIRFAILHSSYNLTHYHVTKFLFHNLFYCNRNQIL